jgi:predicted HicB family RNase H-like nuclease
MTAVPQEHSGRSSEPLRTALKSFRTTPSLIARAKKAATKERLSLSRWIERALERELASEQRTGKTFLRNCREV